MPTEFEIAEKIIKAINLRKYNPHDKLPSENEMAEKFNVPRITARKVYERLEELGYIYKKQGKGSFVRDRSKQIELVLSGDTSFTQKMIEKDYDFFSRNVFCQEIAFNKKVYDYLMVAKQDKVFKVGRLRYVDQKPIALHISYVAQSVFQDIEEVGINITSMFQYFKTKGYNEFTSKPSILSVSFPTQIQQKLLECSSLVPLLELESGCVDKKNAKVLEFSRILYRSDRFSYVIP